MADDVAGGGDVEGLALGRQDDHEGEHRAVGDEPWATTDAAAVVAAPAVEHGTDARVVDDAGRVVHAGTINTVDGYRVHLRFTSFRIS